MLKPYRRFRGRGKLGFVVGIVISPVWICLRNVIKVRKDEELRGPGVTVSLEHWRDSGFLDRFIVCRKLIPCRRYTQSQLLVDLLVVEHTASSRIPDRHPINSFTLGNRGQKRIGNIGDERLSREIDKRLRRIQRLDQSAGVEIEDIVHLTGRQSCLDKVRDLLTRYGWYLEFKGHVGMQRRIGFGERIDHQLIILIYCGKQSHRDGFCSSRLGCSW